MYHHPLVSENGLGKVAMFKKWSKFFQFEAIFLAEYPCSESQQAPLAKTALFIYFKACQFLKTYFMFYADNYNTG